MDPRTYSRWTYYKCIDYANFNDLRTVICKVQRCVKSSDMYIKSSEFKVLQRLYAHHITTLPIRYSSPSTSPCPPLSSVPIKLVGIKHRVHYPERIRVSLQAGSMASWDRPDAYEVAPFGMTPICRCAERRHMRRSGGRGRGLFCTLFGMGRLWVGWFVCLCICI